MWRVLFDPKNSALLRTMDLESLHASIPRLFDLLDQRGVDFVLVGGIAMLVYVEGRNTQDIDIIVAADGPECLPELQIEERKGEFARGRFGGLQVDLLFTRNRLFEKVRREHTVAQRFAERRVRCATVEGLLLLKLFALPSLYRQGRFERVENYERDIAMLVRRYEPELEPIFEELRHHLLESDLVELRTIVGEIEARIARSRGRFGNGE